MLLAVLWLWAATSAAATAGQSCKSSPCMYGICVDDGEGYRCYCIDGYTGVHCEINWDECWSGPCRNGGTCHDAIAAYNCTCPEGFVGPSCEQRYSRCASQPCGKGGSCLEEPASGGFRCQCLEGFSGELCEHDASVCHEAACHNGAQCIEGPGLSFSCRCPEGWTGAFCESDLDECAAAAAEQEPACLNGGLCLNLPGSYQCACLFGFSGRRCERPLLACAPERDLCQNGAVCLAEDGLERCYCVPDYHGPLCELRYDDCESKGARCENGGSCVDGLNGFSCECPPPFTGDNCASLLPTTTSATSTVSDAIVGSATSTTSSSTAADTELGTELGAGTTNVPSSELSGSSGSTTATTATTNVPSSELATSTINVASTELDSQEPGTSADALESRTEGLSGSEPSSSEPDWTTTTTTTSSSSSSSTPTPPVVTMLPSSIASTSTPYGVIDGETTWTTTSLAPDEQRPTRPTDSTADADFTTLGDFHRSTFGSETDLGTTSSVSPEYSPPTSSLAPPDCTPEQCANATRCLQNVSQCDCSGSLQCGGAGPAKTPGPQAGEAGGLSSAAFNGKSYVRQKCALDAGALSVLLRVRTRAKSGILVHALLDGERYALLYLENGQLKFQFSCGLQTMLFGELDSAVNNGHEVELETRFEYAVEAASDRCSARLLVNGSLAMSGEQLLQSHETPPRLARLHLGGIPLGFSQLQLPQIALGFVGCMSRLRLNGRERDFQRDSLEAVQIEECRSFACLAAARPCQHGGACEERPDGSTRCRCVAGYSGPVCERSICDQQPCQLGATCLVSPGSNFVCVCPLGAHGLFCELDASRLLQPSFSLFAPGFSSYLAYGLSGGPPLKDALELRMRIAPHSLEQISLIAFLGQQPPAARLQDHLSLTYVRGYLMLTWDLGSGVRRIFTASPIDTRARKSHAIQLGRRGRDAWLYVEGVGNVTGRAAGTNTRLDVSPILYIGGHKSKYFESLPHDLPLHTGFVGCIYDIELRTDDNVFPITMASQPATGRGVGECHRNECSHHSCKNGAVCLNYGPTYSCICMKDWQGPDCSSPLNCTSSC